MSKKYLMTEEHYHELEELIPEHANALFAYGYDLCRNGYNAGYSKAIGDLCIGIGISVLGFVVFDVGSKFYKKRKDKNTNKTE